MHIYVIEHKHKIYEENGQLVYHRTYKCGNDTEVVGSYIRKIEVKEE